MSDETLVISAFPVRLELSMQLFYRDVPSRA